MKIFSVKSSTQVECYLVLFCYLFISLFCFVLFSPRINRKQKLKPRCLYKPTRKEVLNGEDDRGKGGRKKKNTGKKRELTYDNL